MKCKSCGTKNVPDAKFCVSCGSPLGKSFSPKTNRPEKSGKKGLWIAMAGVLVVAIVLAAVFVFSPNDDDGNMNFGKTAFIGEAVIGAEGGTLTVDDPTSPIDGMTLTVPENAYSQEMTYTIETTEIKSHQLGDMVHPITPLITIDNGHGFADVPMTLTIPIEKEDDEFAMAFFYDRETGELEGIPFLELQNDSITVITAHFSECFVTAEKKGRIREAAEESIDSEFMPGVNDFQMKNFGSIVESCVGGHCAGQSIAAMYYYNNRNRANYSARLYGRYDNDEYEATPNFMWDDAQSMRLCSVVHDNYVNKWDCKLYDMHQKDSDVWYSFAYTIAITKEPQFIDIRTKQWGGSGHCMIVYKVTGDALYVADPNYPGEHFRRIPYKITNGVGDLQSYFSGKDATQATTNSTEYIRFNYIGMYTLFDRSVVAQAWYALEQGGDPGAGLFPADITMTARVVTNLETGAYVEVPLEDNLVIADNQKVLLYPVQVPVKDFIEGDRLLFYKGTEYYSELDVLGKAMGFGETNLAYGDNDIGILHERTVQVERDGKMVDEYRFVNFYRFNIRLIEAPQLSVSPASATAFTGDVIPFVAAVGNVPDDALYTWNFGDGHTETTAEWSYHYAYNAEGAYGGTVTLACASNPDIPLASASFSVLVFEDGETTQTPMPTQTIQDDEDDTDVNISGEWREELACGGGNGTLPNDFDNSYLLSTMYDGYTAEASYRIDWIDEEYIVETAYDEFDVDKIDVYPDYYDFYDQRYYTRIDITRESSETGMEIRLTGELSQDGNTIEGSYYLFFDETEYSFYCGDWTLTRIQ